MGLDGLEQVGDGQEQVVKRPAVSSAQISDGCRCDLELLFPPGWENKKGPIGWSNPRVVDLTEIFEYIDVVLRAEKELKDGTVVSLVRIRKRNWQKEIHVKTSFGRFILDATGKEAEALFNEISRDETYLSLRRRFSD